MSQCLIGLGANRGDPARTFDAALEQLGQRALRLARRSSLWRTAPIGGRGPQQPFLNAAAVLETSLSPAQVLGQLLEVEQRLGRVRTERWAARVIDLDLLLYDQQLVRTTNLVVPHPRLAFRWFAVAPAAEIAPEWIHPQLGWTLAQLRLHLAEAPNYAALCELPLAGGKPDEPSQEFVTAAALADAALEAVSGQLLHAADFPNAPGRPWETVQQHAAALAAFQLDDFPARGSQWLITDFWIEQRVAWARELTGAGPSAELAERLAALPRPKLLAVVQRPESAPYGLTSAASSRPGSPAPPGPWLQLDTADPAWARRELIAALQAMRPDATL